jgi:hypothetical protein
MPQIVNTGGMGMGVTGADLLARLDQIIAVAEGQPNGVQLAARLRAVRDRIAAMPQPTPSPWVQPPLRPTLPDTLQGPYIGIPGPQPGTPPGPPPPPYVPSRPTPPGSELYGRLPAAAPQEAARLARLRSLLAGTPVAGIIRSRLGV